MTKLNLAGKGMCAGYVLRIECILTSAYGYCPIRIVKVRPIYIYIYVVEGRSIKPKV